ncbi:hypothetical protein EDB89DRAFT_2235380 [Lactarius sanguifluus]|nr:hypothetical protein EDB89DRAFT_2235380 [Lactarius sanguifluus]
MSKSDSVPVPVAIDTALPISVPTSVVKGDHTPATGPQNVLDAVVKDGILFADALNAGAKNHWSFRVLADFGRDCQQDIWQIQLAMDVRREASIPLTIVKPPVVDSEGSVSFALLGAAAGGDGSPDAQSVIFSDIESQGEPPKITSSDGVVFEQPTEGAPFQGYFNIKAPVDRHFEPFHFRQLGFAYLGCRDFISQATAAWLRDDL